jgi:hypothetical protein
MPEQIFKLDPIPEEERKEGENFSMKASSSMDRKYPAAVAAKYT